MYDWSKYQIRLDDIEERILQPRYLLLIETGQDQYVALRVGRQRLAQVAYNFVNDGADFLPLAPVNSTGTSGVTQGFFSQHNPITISKLGSQDLLGIPTPRTGNLMQLFYGIAPSYCFVTPEQPGGTQLEQLPNTQLFPQSSYPYIYDNSGFSSPFYRPAKHTELFTVANVTIQFTLVNSVSIPISPKMLFVINNMRVSPIESLDLFRKMLEGTVARRVVSMGQVYSDVTWSSAIYGNVEPVSAKSILGSNGSVAFKNAGYGGS